MLHFCNVSNCAKDFIKHFSCIVVVLCEIHISYQLRVRLVRVEVRVSENACCSIHLRITDTESPHRWHSRFLNVCLRSISRNAENCVVIWFVSHLLLSWLSALDLTILVLQKITCQNKLLSPITIHCRQNNSTQKKQWKIFTTNRNSKKSEARWPMRYGWQAQNSTFLLLL